jgi:hypothetical protein
VEQVEAGELVKVPAENPLGVFVANLEICFLTRVLPHSGQVTPLAEAALRTSSSNGRPQSWQTNSKIGINAPQPVIIR